MSRFLFTSYNLIMISFLFYSCGRLPPPAPSEAITYFDADTQYEPWVAPCDMRGALHFDGYWIKTKHGIRLIKFNQYREKSGK